MNVKLKHNIANDSILYGLELPIWKAMKLNVGDQAESSKGSGLS